MSVTGEGLTLLQQATQRLAEHILADPDRLRVSWSLPYRASGGMRAPRTLDELLFCAVAEICNRSGYDWLHVLDAASASEAESEARVLYHRGDEVRAALASRLLGIE